ncbi:MAG: tRNA lysidine(34) synthetase TilS [Planctomycetes bacterium]|nr:tRNA lysidine(34) synthetase TilS [Planctomycetota bacterium]
MNRSNYRIPAGRIPAGQLPADFCGRYAQVARAVGVEPTEPVVVAFSGGADSVLLLHLVALASSKPPVVAVHVDHGLRGEESLRDALFCEREARRLGVTFVLRRIQLAREGGSLEARAREARYRVLAEEAEARGIRVLLTGHHADDALETLLMRWSRGTALGGLSGPRATTTLVGPSFGAELLVARPLLHMRREEVRCLLTEAGIAWCEDGSNDSDEFTRNRVRNTLLPRISELAGAQGIERLRDFGRAVERLELDLARATAHLAWRPLDAARVTRHADRAHLGGSLPRADLMCLPSALRRRAVWRLLQEGCGAPPRKRLVSLVLQDLERARTGRHALPRGWQLELRASRIDLLPPRRLLDRERSKASSARAIQAELPFPADPACEPAVFGERALSIPGSVLLADGRRLDAEWVERAPGVEPPREATVVELDAAAVGASLTVRFPRRGDRLKPLGAPGSRSLARFLADCHVPRQERANVPLVITDERIAWVAGLRPAHEFRVQAATRRRVRIALYGAPDLAFTTPPRAAGEARELFEADDRAR